MTTQEECYELGYVQKTHGLQGEVLLVLDVADPEEYAEMDSLFLEVKNQLIPYSIQKIDVRRNTAIVKFEETDTFEKAKSLVGCKLFLPLDNLPELDEDDFYYHDVMGYAVLDTHLGRLGIVSNFYELPRQDLLAMQYQGKEVLIPVNDDIVIGVNHEKKELLTNLPEGLLDVYLSNNQQDDGFGEPE